MELYVFDLDGTLTDTNHVDEHCIIGALEETLGVHGLSTDWSTYPYSTDSGIVRHVVETTLGSFQAPAVARIQDRFYEILEALYTSSPSLFQPLFGASSILLNLQSMGFATAIATGSWRESALFKLRVGRVEHAGVPMATADDSVHRTEIITTAIERARALHGVSAFDSVTYVGDGIWDAQAAIDLELPFAGMATGHRAALLAEAGASHIVASPANLLAELVPAA